MTHARRTTWRQVAGPDLDPRSFSATTVPDGPHNWDGGEYERLEAKNRAALAAHFAKPITAKATTTNSTNSSTTTDAAVAARTAALTATIPSDLSIPTFLKRGPTS
jgi:hypothetical protein